MGAMDERDLAAELQATKDDDSEWGEAVSPKHPVGRSEKRRLSAMVSVRLTPTELHALQEHALARDSTVSGLLRQLALGTLATETAPCACGGFRIAPFLYGIMDGSPVSTALVPTSIGYGWQPWHSTDLNDAGIASSAACVFADS